jgi:hypothetical protein
MALMEMDSFKQSELIIRYIRDAKRKVIVGAIIASIVSVLLFVLGSYYLLFRFYERMTRDYYGSLLNGVSSFQGELIVRQTYRDDLTHIATEVGKKKGVDQVWFTDRFGRLVFSTDRELMSQYGNKRLPSQYYDSVQHLWQFENGSPVPRVVPITRFITQRFSIPIYAYDREEYDFVMGIDVRRYVYLPQEMDKILYISIGYIVVFASLLFLPIFFWVTSRFSGITTQVGVMIGAAALRPGKARGGEGPATQGPILQPEMKTSGGRVTFSPEPETKAPHPASRETEGRVKEEKVKEEPGTAPKGEGQTMEVGVNQEPEEQKVEAPGEALALFIEKKKEIFMSEDIQLQFVHASSYVHRSNGFEGTYVYTHRAEEKVYFVSFLLPYEKAGEALDSIDGLISQFNEQIEAAGHVRDFTGSLNAFCLQNSLKLDLSVIAIGMAEGSVRYGSFGSGRALYVKKGSDEVKALGLDLPRLGSVAQEAFNEHSSCADIRFTRDDLFVLLPQNVNLISTGGKDPEEMLKGDLLALREKSAFDICSGIAGRLQGISDIQQTGFVIVKFV